MSLQIAALAGSTALSAASSVAGGYAQARGQRQMAGQYKQMQQESKVQTLQEEVARRRQFFDLMGTNEADLAGRGVTSDSGSYMAIAEESQRQFELDMSNRRFIGDAQTRRLGLASRQANQAARQALTQGWISAGTTLLGGAWRGYATSTGSPGESKSPGSTAGRIASRYV